jgi:hypothetical protein
MQGVAVQDRKVELLALVVLALAVMEQTTILLQQMELQTQEVAEEGVVFYP